MIYWRLATNIFTPFANAAISLERKKICDCLKKHNHRELKIPHANCTVIYVFLYVLCGETSGSNNLLPCKARNIIISTTPQLETTYNFSNAFLDFITCSLLQEKKIANSWPFTQATEYITNAPKTQVVIWAIYIKNCSSTQGKSTTTIIVPINFRQKVLHSLSKQTSKYTRSLKILMNSTSKKIKLQPNDNALV